MSAAFPAPKRAFVTGATGLLGSNIVRAALDAGSEVTALVRDTERGKRLLPHSSGVRIVVGDVTRPESYEHALEGSDALFHTAAYFREYNQPGGPDFDLLERVNVGAVTGLLTAAVRARIPVFVHTSSHGIVAPVAGGLADESSPLTTKPRNGYMASKIRAEELVREFVSRHEIRVPVIRPGWMWGPGDAGPTASGQLFLSIARGRLRVVPRAGNHMVDARDVALACLAAADHGQGTYIVGGTWQPLPAICAEIAQIAGVTPPRTVPPGLALAAAGILQAQARVRRRPSVASRDGVRALIEGTSRRVSSERAERELKVTFRPPRQTLEDEATWYRTYRMLH